MSTSKVVFEGQFPEWEGRFRVKVWEKHFWVQYHEGGDFLDDSTWVNVNNEQQCVNAIVLRALRFLSGISLDIEKIDFVSPFHVHPTGYGPCGKAYNDPETTHRHETHTGPSGPAFYKTDGTHTHTINGHPGEVKHESGPDEIMHGVSARVSRVKE